MNPSAAARVARGREHGRAPALQRAEQGNAQTAEEIQPGHRKPDHSRLGEDRPAPAATAEIAVAEETQLRRARGAGGEHGQRRGRPVPVEPRIRCGRGQFLRPGGRHQRGVVEPARGLRVDHGQRGLGCGHVPGQVFAAHLDVHRHRGQAGLPGSEQAPDQLDAVGQGEQDAVALAQPRGPVAARHPRRPGEDLGERPGPVVGQEGDVLVPSLGTGVLGQPLGQILRHSGENPSPEPR